MIYCNSLNKIKIPKFNVENEYENICNNLDGLENILLYKMIPSNISDLCNKDYHRKLLSKRGDYTKGFVYFVEFLHLSPKEKIEKTQGRVPMDYFRNRNIGDLLKIYYESELKTLKEERELILEDIKDLEQKRGMYENTSKRLYSDHKNMLHQRLQKSIKILGEEL